MISYWHDNILVQSVCLSICLSIVAKRHILQQVSEQMNRKCPARNVFSQLSIPYIDPEPQNSPFLGPLAPSDE